MFYIVLRIKQLIWIHNMLRINSYALYSLLLFYEDWNKYCQDTSVDIFYYVLKSILLLNPRNTSDFYLFKSYVLTVPRPSIFV